MLLPTLVALLAVWYDLVSALFVSSRWVRWWGTGPGLVVQRVLAAAAIAGAGSWLVIRYPGESVIGFLLAGLALLWVSLLV